MQKQRTCTEQCQLCNKIIKLNGDIIKTHVR